MTPVASAPPVRASALARPKYPFTSEFVAVMGHRIHYVSHGSGAPVLFVHGNPTSSYLWRDVLPHVAERTGRRGIALDLLGFGESDKPKGVTYTLDLHARIIAGFVDALKLREIVLVADDWGGPLSMRHVVSQQELYEAAVLMETFLWTFTFADDFAPKFRMPFRIMRGPLGFVFVQVLNMMIRKLIPEHCAITDEGMSYYLDSMPTVGSRRAMLELVRLNPVHGRPRASVEFIESVRRKLPELHIPITWLKASPGVVPSDDYPRSLERLAGLQELVPHMRVRQFGTGHHFLAEENPSRVVDMVVEAIAELPRRPGS
jgi:haloalkane dehalogenase